MKSTKPTKNGGVIITGGHITLAPTKVQEGKGKTSMRKIDGVACSTLFVPEELSKRFTDAVPRGYRYQAICTLMSELLDRVEAGELVDLDAGKVTKYMPQPE